jgi:hypothetical protein
MGLPDVVNASWWRGAGTRPDSVGFIEDSAFDSVLSVTRIEAQRLFWS